MSLDISLICKCCGTDVFEQNITHNLSGMASAADIYYPLWMAENIETAKDLIKPLKSAIKDMIKRPDHYKQYEPENKWGTYDIFVPWLKDLFRACVKNPNCIIEVWK